MTALSSATDRMAGHLTVPFARGADRVDLPFAGGGTASAAELAGYDLDEHRAAFGRDPSPRYVVSALRDVPAATVITVRYQDARGDAAAVEVPVPAGTLAGASLALPLGAPDPAVRLRSVEVSPAGAEPVSDTWRITALLGDIAALLWAVGGEKDALAGHLDRVRGQRALANATGRSLDLIGSDLRVRRFPPLPYSFEPDTVALYHLDEPAKAGQVADAMALYRGTSGHPGTVTGVQLGVPGRFGPGARFAGPAEIRIASHADFAVSESDSLTVECFVRPDSDISTDNGDGVALLSKQGGGSAPGWTMSIGSFGRGIPRNVRWSLTDGQRAITLFADLALDPSRFQHVAGVLDRAAGRARLYVDGQPRASRPATELGALTNDAPLLAGSLVKASALHGMLSELRISRAARAGFHPVLGEGDDSYRRRLGIFRRWTLPTPANLQAALNEVAGVPDLFVVHDAEARTVAGHRTLVVRPARVASGEAVDALGRRDGTEAEASGTVAGDTAVDTALLADGSDPRVVFAPAPTGADPRRMRPGTRRALRALLDLLGPEAPQGRLVVVGGFDPNAGDLRAVGRALVLRHESVATDRLAALAHRAGFSWVRHRADTGDAYVSVASTETLELVAVDGRRAAPGLDAVVGQPLELRVEPAPPPGAEYRWSVVHHEHGRAELVSPPDAATCRLVPGRPGRLVVTVQVRRAGRTATASRTVRAGVLTLPIGASIGADGRLGVAESVAGTPDDAPFRPSLLVPVLDPGMPARAEANRMLPDVRDALLRLVGLLATAGLGGRLRLASSWQPGAAGLDGVGRALVLEHTDGPAPNDPAQVDRMAALAHAAGFDYVTATASTIRVAHRAGDPMRLVGPLDASDGSELGGDDVTEGDALFFRAEPRALPTRAAMAGTTLCVACAGTSTVSMLDADTGRVLRAVPTGLSPAGIAASPDGATVYTVSVADPSVTAISVATGAVRNSVALPPTSFPRAIAHHPTAAGLVVLCARELILLASDTLTVTRTVALPPGVTANAMAIDPDGNRVWVCSTDGKLRTVTMSTSVVSAPIALPGAAVDVAVSPTRIYVAMPGKGFGVLDRATPTSQVTFTDAGPLPQRVAVDPARQAVYVADQASRQVSVRAPDGSAVVPAKLMALPGAPTHLLVADDRLFFTTVTNAESPFDGADAAGVLDPGTERPSPVFWPLGSGFGERLTWSAQPAAGAEARLGGTSAQVARLSATRAGPVLLTARYTVPGEEPFTFRVGLRPRQAAGGRVADPVVITKQQYDLVMNVLSELHPLGVEIDTSEIRAHVLELRAGLADAFPAYTYPTYRGRQPSLSSKDH